MGMKKLGFAVFAVVFFAAALPAGAASCSWPAYENDLRFWGEVTSVYSTTGGHVVALEVYGYAAPRVYARIECGDAVQSAYLGCDQVAAHDSILLRGSLEDLLAVPPQPDGIVNVGVARVIFRCLGWTAGTCTKLTACD